MKIERHSDNTEIKCGLRGEDIHEWIDQFFDAARFRRSARWGFADGWNPYNHRKNLHYRETLPLVVETFREIYSEKDIECVFLQHLRDDYHGYIPQKTDFDDPQFLRKYHRLF